MKRVWEELSETEQALVMDIRDNGADCAKFISRRHGLDLRKAMDLLSQLEKSGWLQRVKGTFLFKRGFRKPKHMNHTYYSLTRPATLFLRGLK